MDLTGWSPHGRALMDYHRGDADAVLVITSNLGDRDPMPVKVWFRGPDEYFELDRAALELARGSVLDVGAGVGVHALALQARGQAVTAIDHVPEAVEVMRARGVRDARCCDFREVDGRFGTVMALANGAGLARTLAGLTPFLRELERRLEPGGLILLDSTDLRPQFGATRAGRYVGELEFRLEYKGERGDPFPQLYVDPDALAEHAACAGLAVAELRRFDSGGYLAVLARSAEVAVPANGP